MASVAAPTWMMAQTKVFQNRECRDKNNIESMLVVTHQEGHEIKNKGEKEGTGTTRKADPQKQYRF